MIRMEDLKKRGMTADKAGKTFVLYAGLLQIAHEHGLRSITTSLVQIPSTTNGEVAVAHARVTLVKDGVEHTFTGIGDAAQNNCTPMVQNARIRMAETRAKARALRDAVNVGVTCYEELPDPDFISDGDEDLNDVEPAPPPARATPPPAARPRTRQAAAPARTPAPVPVDDVGPPATPQPSRPAPAMGNAITKAQTDAIASLCRRKGFDADAVAQQQCRAPLASLTITQGSDLIKYLNELVSPRTPGRAMVPAP